MIRTYIRQTPIKKNLLHNYHQPLSLITSHITSISISNHSIVDLPRDTKLDYSLIHSRLFRTQLLAYAPCALHCKYMNWYIDDDNDRWTNII